MSLLARVNTEIQDYYLFEEQNTRQSAIFSVSPILKLLATIWMLYFANYITNSEQSQAILGGIFMVAAILVQIPKKRYLTQFITLGLIFPIVVTLPLIFIEPGHTLWSIQLNSHTIGITLEGVLKARVFIVRIAMNITIILFFTLSTPFLHVIWALHKLHLPQILITNLLLTYRYVFLFFDNLTKILRADSCRRPDSYPFKKRFQHISTIFGMLLLRSIHRGEKVYDAMRSRGYTGTIPMIDFRHSYLRSAIYFLGFAILTAIMWVNFAGSGGIQL